MRSIAWMKVAGLAVAATCALAPLTACAQEPAPPASAGQTTASPSTSVAAHVDPKNCPGGEVNGGVYDNAPGAQGAATPEQALAPVQATLTKDRVLPEAAERKKTAGDRRTEFSYVSGGVTVASIAVQTTGNGWFVTEAHHCGPRS